MTTSIFEDICYRTRIRFKYVRTHTYTQTPSRCQLNSKLTVYEYYCVHARARGIYVHMYFYLASFVLPMDVLFQLYTVSGKTEL